MACATQVGHLEMWSDDEPEACYNFFELFLCCPDKNMTWPDWAHGDAAKGAQKEREESASKLKEKGPQTIWQQHIT